MIELIVDELDYPFVNHHVIQPAGRLEDNQSTMKL
jgi:hypothetical protein